VSVLVTGAGLIGRLTAGRLAARGERVVLADVRHPAAMPGVACVVGDVTDAVALEGIVRGFNVSRVIHTAALLSTGIRADPVAGVRVNVMGTVNVLDVARRCGLGRVVCASSSTVGYTTFGRHSDAPIEEDLPLRLISERPASLYAATKIAGEHLGLLYHDLYGVDVVMLRYAAVLGAAEGAPSSVPGRLLAHLAAGAREKRPVVLDDPFMVWGGREEFVDARDCAAANVAALDAQTAVQRVYNVATGGWVSLGEFVEAAQSVLPGLEVMVPPDSGKGFAGFPHVRPAPSDVAAAARELGFRCGFGLAETIAYAVGAP
jgi:UDP-glucose 4-epimerase